MKKVTIIILLALFAGYSVFAQENERKEYNNEIKINIATTIFSWPEINYERIMSDNIGLGAAVAFSVSEDMENKFLFMPYLRVYFGSKRAQGFFTEVNAALAAVRTWEYSYSSSYNYSKEKTEIQPGVGFSVGYKYEIPNKGIVGEVYTGLGRLTDDLIYPRIGIAIGKQF